MYSSASVLTKSEASCGSVESLEISMIRVCIKLRTTTVFRGSSKAAGENRFRDVRRADARSSKLVLEMIRIWVCKSVVSASRGALGLPSWRASKLSEIPWTSIVARALYIFDAGSVRRNAIKDPPKRPAAKYRQLRRQRSQYSIQYGAGNASGSSIEWGGPPRLTQIAPPGRSASGGT